MRSYDYVIVGAGSAGCVLAARLSEDPDVTVCLIEAGPPDSDPNIHIPAAFAGLFRSRIDWDYDSHEEEFLNRRRVFLPRGKVLGGSSSINAMIYTRAQAEDFAEWAIPGWSYDDLLPYYLIAEDNELGASRLHGSGGPLRVSEGRARNPSIAAFLDAAVEAGHPRKEDFARGSPEGFGWYQVTQRDGRRESAATAYLHPNLHRANLAVFTGRHVHRVLVENGRAVGVVADPAADPHHGPETVRAEREVVLCAGAYNSPQLLMLSGIGAAAALSPLGIEIVTDLPAVGQNLSDHVIAPLNYLHEHPVSMLAARAPEHVETFMTQGRGPLTANGPEGGGFLRSSEASTQVDLQYLLAAVMYVDSGLAMPTGHALSCGPALLTPRSRGRVELASDGSTVKPRIVHNYLAEDADVTALVEGVRVSMDIARMPAMTEYARTLHRAPASESRTDVREYVRRFAHSIYHPAGSCAMGAVVDEQLRVRGVDGLRVVDASVMPTIGRAAPNATIIALAERASDVMTGRDRASQRARVPVGADA